MYYRWYGGYRESDWCFAVAGVEDYVDEYTSGVVVARLGF